MSPVPSPRSFTSLERDEQLDHLVRDSFSQPVLVFKHSPSCGTSFFAMDELETYLRQSGAVHTYIVDVLSRRSLSNEIARRFGVRHQSPQVLLVVDGQARWNASHYGVTSDSVVRALGSVDSVPQV